MGKVDSEDVVTLRVQEDHIKDCPGGCGSRILADAAAGQVMHALVDCSWWDATPAREILNYVLGKSAVRLN